MTRTDTVALVALGVLGVFSVLAGPIAVLRSRRARVRRGEPADLGQLVDTLLPAQAPPVEDQSTAGDVVDPDDVVVDGPVDRPYVPDVQPPATAPIVVDGPRGARGLIRAEGLDVHIVASCSYCRDDGFLGGCVWCGAVPLMENPPEPPVAEWAAELARDWKKSGQAHDEQAWRNS